MTKIKKLLELFTIGEKINIINNKYMHLFNTKIIIIKKNIKE